MCGHLPALTNHRCVRRVASKPYPFNGPRWNPRVFHYKKAIWKGQRFYISAVTRKLCYQRNTDRLQPSGEHARGDVHVNLAENWFSLLKRGVNGTFHHVIEQHLDRYVGEFQFLYNNRKISDGERARRAIEGIEGKRLVHKGTINQKAGN